MLFPTMEFAIFFLAVFMLSWSLKNYAWSRKTVLVIASYIFYGYWDWRFLFLLLECSLVNFLLGMLIEASIIEKRRKLLMIFGVIFNLGILATFKYLGFFISSFSDLLNLVGFSRDLPMMEILLPTGISFFTFQGISYVIDVYRRDIKATNSLVDILLYISFFPQLVAGPILRAHHFLPQLAQLPDGSQIRATHSFILIAGGLFKKVVIAHYISESIVTPVFDSPTTHSTFDLLCAVYGYAVQIYCDFSAYSDIAIGTAGLLGFHVNKNFNQPYRADSIQNFWHRWHISLSTWLRDYLYIPLGGSRNGKVKNYRNLFLTMFLGGLWHGAAWNFLIWGSMHGTALGIEKYWRQTWKPLKLPGFLRIFLVFHFVCLTWVFFAAESNDIALTYLASLINWDLPIQRINPFVIGLLTVGMGLHFLPEDFNERLENFTFKIPISAQALVLGFIVVAICAMSPGTLAPFIYFRF